MENTENTRRKVPVVILIVALVQIIFIVLVVFIINRLSQEDKIQDRNEYPKVTIESLTQKVENLPGNYAEDLQISLTDAIEQNTDNFSLSSSSAIIREDSISLLEFNRNGFNALNFIVDIPDLQQSYQIFYKYPTNIDFNAPFSNNPRAVLCIEDQSQIIYPDFNCRSSYPVDVRYRIISDYFNFIEFDDFAASVDPQNSSKINITPAIDPTDAVKKAYIEQVKSAIRSLGVSPDIFTYHILTNEDINYYIPNA